MDEPTNSHNSRRLTAVDAKRSYCVRSTPSRMGETGETGKKY